MNRLAENILLALLLCLPLIGRAQISGRVVSAEDGAPLAGATVLIENSEGKHLAYLLTDSEGDFAFKSTPKGAVRLSVSLMSYAARQIPIEGTSFPITIRLEEKPFKLKEVAVQAKSIIAEGDTVTYLTSAFTGKNDHSIGDVMKRTPGIEVDKSGKVSYQGKEISRFYIEGQDLLGNKYGVATKGVAADDIGAVEVLENHQPFRVLQGVSFSDQAAINLKLKEGRKSAWLVHGSVGGGSMHSPHRGLYGGDLFALRASSETQTLLSLKGNNTGSDLSEEQMEFGLSTRGTDLRSPLELSLLPSAELLPQRTLLNGDGLLSLNHLLRLSPTLQAKVMADYLEDRRSAAGERRTTYLSPEGDREIVEKRADRARHRMLRGRVMLEANQPSYYLSNTTRAQLDREQTDLETSGTFANRQIGYRSDLYLSNQLQVIRRVAGDHFIFITSDNEWESLPSRLQVAGKGVDGTEQIADRAFSTRESLSYSYHMGAVSIGMEAGILGLFRRLAGEGTGDLPADVTASQRLDLLGASLSPTLKWQRRSREVSLRLPLEYSHCSFGEAGPARQFLLFSPSLSLRAGLRRGLTVSLGASGGRSPLSPSELYEGQLLTDYRTVRSGYRELLLRSSYRLSASIVYRELSRGIFSYLMLLHSGSESPYKTRRELEKEGLVRLYNDPERSRTEVTSVISRLNYAIGPIRGGGSLQVLYTHTLRSVVAEGKDVRYAGDLVTAKGMLNSDLSSRLFLLYELSCSGHRLTLPAHAGLPSPGTGVYTLTHSLEATYTPVSPLVLSLRGEYYISKLTPEVTKRMTMVDLDLTWTLSPKVEVEAGLHNLLDNNVWSYTTYGTLLRQTIVRQLRGRSFLLTLRVK